MPPAQNTSPKKRILCIEDNELFSTVLKKEVDKAGYEVVVARDGKEGIELLYKKICDLILLDILMPNVDGFEFLETIRKNPSLKSIPVVILSNLGSPADIEKARALGVSLFLIKDQNLPSQIIAAFGKVLEEQAQSK